jgi:hypothetical protein
MSEWPSPQAGIPPEGSYAFRVTKEPDIKEFDYTKKDGSEHIGKRLVLYVEASNETGTFNVVDSFIPWEPRYADLCAALNVEHGKDIHVSGRTFLGEIIHEADKKDAKKIYPRIIKIKAGDEDTPFSGEDDESEIPF